MRRPKVANLRESVRGALESGRAPIHDHNALVRWSAEVGFFLRQLAHELGIAEPIGTYERRCLGLDGGIDDWDHRLFQASLAALRERRLERQVANG